MPHHKRILFFPFNLLSHYSRSLMLANAIKDQCDVHILHSSQYAPLIEQFGIPSFPCKSLDANEILEHSRKFSFGWIRERQLEEVLAEQVRVLKQWKPELVIGDADWTLRMAAEYCQIPFYAIVNAYMSSHYQPVRRLPSFHPAHRFKRYVSENVFDWITKRGEELAFRKYHVPFQKIRRKWGLKHARKLIEELEGDRTFIVDDPHLFPLKQLPRNVNHIGPLYYDHEGLDGLPEIQPASKLVLICMGSSGNKEKINFFRLPLFRDFQFVVAGYKGPHPTTNTNFIFREFTPLGSILPFAHLLICHGGNGTIYHALQHKVPILAFPSHFEQEWNMEQVIRLHLGDTVAEKAPAEEVKKKMEYWIALKKHGLYEERCQLRIDLKETLKNFKQALLS